MTYDWNQLKKKIKDTEDWLSKEFQGIRTGRATPALLDSISIEVYGSYMPISQVATILNEDPKTLRISPWDLQNIKSIEKAIMTSNLGVSVSVDEKGLRVSFPPLTSESRTQFVKVAKQKLEDAKVSLRQERNRVNDDLQEKKKNSEMGEDEMMRAKAEMEKLVKEANEALDGLFKKKETDILS